jgi:spore maturation protein CgeB
MLEEGYIENNDRVHLLGCAYPGEFRNYSYYKENSKYKFDVLFIGAAEKERIDSLNYLAQNGIKINIYGGGWNKIDKTTLHHNLVINAYDLVGSDYADAISCSKISLCFLRKINRDLHTSRSIEIPACKGFMLAERTNEHLSLFKEGIEAEFFTSDEELLKKVNYYLLNEEKRQEVIEKGYQKCIEKDYSYDNMLARILDAI